MLEFVAGFSLLMCAANWALFVFIVFSRDLPDLRNLWHSLTNPPATGQGGMGVTVQHAAVDPAKLATATGTLAGAFKKAGPAPTAAAMSMVFLLVALIAAGVDKF